MKPRTAVHLLIGIIVAVILVFFASNLQAGSGSSLSELINAQKQAPVLWIVDACAVGLVAGMWWAAVILNHFHNFVDHQASQHAEQLDDMIERTNEIERINDAYIERIERLEAELARQYRDLSDQIATLESAADARRKIFETETRRISEHAYRLFQSQLENNASQLEAVHIAIQYQRAELRRLRSEIRELQMDIAPQRRSPSLTEAPPASALDSQQRALFIEGASAEHNSPQAIEPGNSANGGAAHWKNQVERLFHEAQIVDRLTDEDLGLTGKNAAQSEKTLEPGRDSSRDREAQTNPEDAAGQGMRSSTLDPATEAMA